MDKEKEKQYIIIDGQRPDEDNPICEKGILQKLTSLQRTVWLYTATPKKRCPYSEWERLKMKYKGQYKIRNGLLSWLDGVNYVVENRGL